MVAIFSGDNILKQGLFVAQVPINRLNAELNPICHLLYLLGTHHILHVSRIRVNTGCVGYDKCRLVRDMVTKSVVQCI